MYNTNSNSLQKKYSRTPMSSISSNKLVPSFTSAKPQSQTYTPEEISKRMEQIRRKYIRTQDQNSQPKQAPARQKENSSPSQKLAGLRSLATVHELKIAESIDCKAAAKQADPRIQNIDKINQKIRNILNSISKDHILQTEYKPLETRQQALLTREEKHTQNRSPAPRPSFEPGRQRRYSTGGRPSYNTVELRQRALNMTTTSSSSKYLQPQTSTSNFSSNSKPYSYLASIPNVASTESITPPKKSLPGITGQFEQSIVISKPLGENQQKQQIGRLIKCLKRQVTLDQNLRNKKYAFKEIRNNPKKGQQLIRTLQDLKVHFDKQTILNDIEITEAEYNPFYTFREDDDIRCIAQAYKQAEQHWSSSIIRRFDAQKLEAEGMRGEIMNFNRKGYLAIQDFVRWLNNEADNLYRNRDLVLIFRRLTQADTQRLDFDKFLEAIKQ